jgi:hypothetical protein
MTRPLSEAEMTARFDTNTAPVDGGHLEWTGPQRIEWRGHKWRPAALAFYLRTGRQPQGNVLPDCGHCGCVQPQHVEDEAGRTRIRLQVRALRGLPPPAPTCRRGHDLTIYGDLRADGITHCAACTQMRRAARAAAQEVTA